MQWYDFHQMEQLCQPDDLKMTKPGLGLGMALGHVGLASVHWSENEMHSCENLVQSEQWMRMKVVRGGS